jgi:hypothetical protein
VGYFSVPSVANYIIHAHGGNGLLNRVTSVASSAATTVVSAAGDGAAAAGARMERARDNIRYAPSDFMTGWNSAGSGGSQYQKDRLSGKG